MSFERDQKDPFVGQKVKNLETIAAAFCFFFKNPPPSTTPPPPGHLKPSLTKGPVRTTTITGLYGIRFRSTALVFAICTVFLPLFLRTEGIFEHFSWCCATTLANSRPILNNFSMGGSLG